MNTHRGSSISVVALTALLVVGGCSSSRQTSSAIASLDALPDLAPPASTPATTTAAPSERQAACVADHMETASYPALETDDGFVADLRDRGRIRVGLDENTRGLSVRDPRTGEFEGFEVDLAHEIAKRLFGAAYDPETSVVPVPLVTSEKTKAVADESVDLTISAVSMSCARWEQVDFSAEYYTAHQMFLVRSDSDIHKRSDLDDRTVCVTSNSSSQSILAGEVPAADLLPLAARTDCLLALQLGEADAYFGHDTFLYGMLEQDPTVEIRDLLPPEVTVSHYGIAVNRQHPEFTRYVNWALNDIDDGRWNELVSDWLTPIGISDVVRPAPDYRRVG